MRENCLPQIADAWYSILQLQYSAPSLCAMCLNTLAQYINWIDISLVANERFMRLLVPFMHTSALHDGACACLTEIVTKRMDASLKLEHLARLQVARPLSHPPAPPFRTFDLLGCAVLSLPSSLHASVLSQMIDLLSDAASSWSSMSVKFSTLVSGLALEILDCWDRLGSRNALSAEVRTQASQAVEGVVRTMPLLLNCLASSDIEVSLCTMGFLHSYVGRLRKLASSPKELEAHEPHLRNLLVSTSGALCTVALLSLMHSYRSLLEVD